jgi:hypothetical protein
MLGAIIGAIAGSTSAGFTGAAKKRKNQGP